MSHLNTLFLMELNLSALFSVFLLLKGNVHAWSRNRLLVLLFRTMNAEELELLGDSKYRNYVAAVDKALKNFEYSSEWADLISALGKLNKVIAASPVVTYRQRWAGGSRWSFILYFVTGIAKQWQVPGCAQETDNWEASGPMPPPGAAQRGSPQGPGDLRDHLQDHWPEAPGKRSFSL